MPFQNCKNALITGASSGLGKEFALQLAKAGTNCVLVARRKDLLEEVALEVRKCGVKAYVIESDLTDSAARAKFKSIFQKYEIDLLVNNAGFGKIGPFAKSPVHTSLQQIELNVCALVELSHLAVSFFTEKKQGMIVNIASTAAFTPMPFFSIYAATKSFVRDFSQTLNFELKGTGIRVIVICPGPTETEFFNHAGNAGQMKVHMMDASKAVSEALDGISKGKSQVVLGLSNKLLAAATAFIPRTAAMKFISEIVTKDR